MALPRRWLGHCREGLVSYLTLVGFRRGGVDAPTPARPSQGVLKAACGGSFQGSRAALLHCKRRYTCCVTFRPSSRFTLFKLTAKNRLRIVFAFHTRTVEYIQGYR